MHFVATDEDGGLCRVNEADRLLLLILLPIALELVELVVDLREEADDNWLVAADDGGESERVKLFCKVCEIRLSSLLSDRNSAFSLLEKVLHTSAASLISYI